MPAALITGASRGLGAALAHGFWRAGYSLFLVARDERTLRGVAGQFEPRSNQAVQICTADLADSASPQVILDAFRANFLTCDALVNNAAIHGPIAPFVDSSLDDWNAAMSVDLLAPVALCRAFLPMMMGQGPDVHRTVINISGGGASKARPNFSAYASAKTALVRFSETIAVELEGSGVTVNSIAPGAMSTDLLKEILASEGGAGTEELENARRVISSGGASLEAVVELALFLASERGRAISGKLISAVWDRYADWPQHIDELRTKELYTLRRLTARDRGLVWGDK